MAGYIVKSGNYRIEDIGIVHINVKANARAVKVRWRGGELLATVPRAIEYDRFVSILKSMLPELEHIKPQTMYHEGQKLDFGELVVNIKTQNRQPERIFAQFDNNRNGVIEVGTGWDFDSADTMKTISKFICRMAQCLAPGVLLPRARELAAEVGKAPLIWTISNGHRVVGHCNAKGEIALSYALIFYPQDLRDYVIYHELAHLSELNHSARFHEICDAYCHGREKELIARFKAHRTPIVK